MSLTKDAFLRLAKRLTVDFPSYWTLVQPSSSSLLRNVSCDYLVSSKQAINVKSTEEKELYADLEDESCQDVEESTVTVPVGQVDPAVFQFHIIYSRTHKVPMLYFQGIRSGGLIEIDSLLVEGGDNFITQLEHPVLGTPFLAVHPCKTALFMSLLMKESGTFDIENYLLSWLGIVGNALKAALLPPVHTWKVGSVCFGIGVVKGSEIPLKAP